jgi:hypothetical protein
LGAFTLREIQERIRVLEKKAVSDITDPQVGKNKARIGEIGTQIVNI